MNVSSRLHVAVGVALDANGRVLIAQRPKNTHLGGFWEFPGGKLESGETAYEALRRELAEEVGVCVLDASPMIRVAHDYPERRVLLDVWRVTAWSGAAHGREGQIMRWVAVADLQNYAFPSANAPIVTALKLPEFYAVLEAATPAEAEFRLERMRELGVTLVQIRLKTLPAPLRPATAAAALAFCRRRGMQTLLNADLVEVINPAAADGLHLTSRALKATDRRPPGLRWLAASCHDAGELARAAQIGADFAVLAPALPTASHPGQPALGWDLCGELLDQAKLPAYLMGGLGLGDLARAQRAGAQGVAGISAFY